MTFRDVWKYIQTAERNAVGYNFCAGETEQNAKDCLHIYGSFRQVNLCERDVYGGFTSWCNIVFSVGANPDVKVYTVRQGICDYDHPIQYTLDSEVPIWISAMLGNYIK